MEGAVNTSSRESLLRRRTRRSQALGHGVAFKQDGERLGRAAVRRAEHEDLADETRARPVRPRRLARRGEVSVAVHRGVARDESAHRVRDDVEAQVGPAELQLQRFDTAGEQSRASRRCRAASRRGRRRRCRGRRPPAGCPSRPRGSRRNLRARAGGGGRRRLRARTSPLTAPRRRCAPRPARRGCRRGRASPAGSAHPRSSGRRCGQTTSPVWRLTMREPRMPGMTMTGRFPFRSRTPAKMRPRSGVRRAPHAPSRGTHRRRRLKVMSDE